MASDADIEAAQECKSDEECEATAEVEGASPSPSPGNLIPNTIFVNRSIIIFSIANAYKTDFCT